jgi:hypothetical protein
MRSADLEGEEKRPIPLDAMPNQSGSSSDSSLYVQTRTKSVGSSADELTLALTGLSPTSSSRGSTDER